MTYAVPLADMAALVAVVVSFRLVKIRVRDQANVPMRRRAGRPDRPRPWLEP